MDAAIFADLFSPTAREIFRQHGLRLCDDPSRADLLWVRKGYRQRFSQLGPDQLINHLPAERCVVDKGRLTEHLNGFAALDSDRSRLLGGLYPETYCLYDPDERERLLARLLERGAGEDLWILKPDQGSEGRGIRLVPQRDLYDQLALAVGKPVWRGAGRYVVQRYVSNPLLIRGRKSAVRFFVLVASLDPLRVAVYRDGFVRINSVPYRQDDLDPVIHLTNTRQQRDHPDYDPSKQVWTLPQLESYLADELGSPGTDFVEQQLLPRVHQAVGFAFRAAGEGLSARPPRGHCFGLFGVDFVLDAALRPWLLEIQVNPGLKHHDPAKRQIIPPLLAETIRAAREVRDRRRSGKSLARLGGLDRFLWVVNEAGSGESS